MLILILKLIIYLILVISCYTAEVKNYKYTFEKKMELKGHEGSVFATYFFGDGSKIASGGKDGRVKLWDLETGKDDSKY